MTERQDHPLDEILQVLASGTRRRMIERLAQGSAYVTELAELAGVSVPAISRHLRQMEQAGVVRRIKEGRRQRCEFRRESLQACLDWFGKLETPAELEMESLSDFARKLKLRP